MVGGLAYVTDDSFGLRIIDVSNPAAPVELGGLFGPAADVEVVGGLAYVARGGLRIIDVSNPAVPLALGAIDTPGDRGRRPVPKGESRGHVTSSSSGAP